MDWNEDQRDFFPLLFGNNKHSDESFFASANIVVETIFKLQFNCKASFRRANLCSPQIICAFVALEKWKWEFYHSWLHFPKIMKHTNWSKNKQILIIRCCQIFIGCFFFHFIFIHMSILFYISAEIQYAFHQVLIWVFAFNDSPSQATCLQNYAF